MVILRYTSKNNYSLLFLFFINFFKTFILIILFFLHLLIKVWSLGPVSVLLFSFPGEHSRNTLFRNLGMGVSHLYIDAYGRLFSCGADCSLKVIYLIYSFLIFTNSIYFLIQQIRKIDRNSNIICSL